ncbi:hypothetical protein AMK68_00190 [candidate division KD3-62 bacterium DG_56]|uniref:Uncharacterized protein n=1 Tax=candidate division KD3-62 bacterium DG_56 TaxID=1704032 RepID=A0A0S7XR40_9BACT|nr:MAG: hypothetical protein AMK68_00190 [candidate division KD3-62 bacterium DG_56]
MRTVLQGTPKKLYRLRERDLPDDYDLTNSFWHWVDFSGFDLSAYIMEDMDVYDSDGSGCALPENGTKWLMSRRTDWTGARLPSDVSSYNHDLVVEVMRQARPFLSGLPRQVAEIVIANVSASYHNSWRDSIYLVRMKLGITAQQALDNGLPMFEGYPRLESRLRAMIVDGKGGHPDPPDLSQDMTRVVGTWGDRREENFSGIAFLGRDRWALARMMEQTLTQKYGPIIEGHAYVAQIEPYPRVFFHQSNNPDWWKKMWPVG